MLTKLLGSKSCAEILLFLLVNHKGYATQIAHTLNLPQTPIQKGLDRLEKAGILLSHLAGRTKLYQMNPSYPLNNALENLLLRTFALLPKEQKERYPLSHTPPTPPKVNTGAILDTFWTHLKRVTHTLVRASQTKPTPHTYHSVGTVTTTQADNALTFHETGTWKESTGRPIDYKNTLRWTRHWASGLLSLEHLRYGENHPVFLFYLIPKAKTLLESSATHLCLDDTYTGKLTLEGSNLKLTWQTVGPNKHETIESIYS